MENIFQFATGKVADGAEFSVDFENKTLVLDGKNYVVEGETLGVPILDSKGALNVIENFYKLYKHSVPSERSEKKKRKYFKALPEKDLSNDDMLFGEQREYAQITLELSLLCFIVNGSIRWDESEWGSYFWQSKSDKDLVILRKWIEPNN